MIDFGLASKYMVDGVHIKSEKINQFGGNPLFCSPNQLDFKATSRRDDMISLCYLLIYLFNGKLFEFNP